MSTTTKVKILNSLNGTDQLFSVGDDYIQGTLCAFVVAQDGTCTIPTTQYFQGGFFQLPSAPAATSTIYCIYEVQLIDATDPSNFSLNGTSVKNITDILGIIKTMQETLFSMDSAIQNRITVTDFTKFTDQVNAKLDVIKLNKELSNG